MEGISPAVVAGSTPSFPSFLGAYFAIIPAKIKNQLPCILANTLQPVAEKQPVFGHATIKQSNTANCIHVHNQRVFRCALPLCFLFKAHFLKQDYL